MRYMRPQNTHKAPLVGSTLYALAVVSLFSLPLSSIAKASPNASPKTSPTPRKVTRVEKRKDAPPKAPPQEKPESTSPKADTQKAESPWAIFFTLQQGMVWWHAFDPKVVSLTFGSAGFRYRWFEMALGFGSPAWGKFRTKGLYELFLKIGFHSYKRDWLRLRHTAAFGILFHNPPFETHTSRPPVHVDFAVLDLRLGGGFWISLSPFTISAVPRYHLSSSFALRYELN